MGFAAGSGTFQANVGYGERATPEARRTMITPGMRMPTERDHVYEIPIEEARGMLTRMRTADFTDELVASLDDQNVRRMARMEIWAQNAIVEAYRTGGRVIHNPQGHFGRAANEFRHILERGLDEIEWNRLRKASYKDGVADFRIGECYGWSRTGCSRADACKFAHIGEPGAFIRDAERRMEQATLEPPRRGSRGPYGRRDEGRGREGPAPPPDTRTVQQRLDGPLELERTGGGTGGNTRVDMEDL